MRNRVRFAVVAEKPVIEVETWIPYPPQLLPPLRLPWIGVGIVIALGLAGGSMGQ